MIKSCQIWQEAQQSYIVVTIQTVVGSSPREVGASLAVSAQDVAGTIGGGWLEWETIQTAREMLNSRQTTLVKTTTLGPETGQCCGGKVTLHFKLGNLKILSALALADANEKAKRPLIHVYGAGHVGRALAQALSPLPLQIFLLDSRENELAQCQAVGVQKELTHSPVVFAENAPDDTAHVIMTHDHALDAQIAGAILEKGNFRYLGIIGSKSKRARFRKAFQQMGHTKQLIDRVTCPIGGKDVSDKRPEVIAALTAAEIVRAVFV
jgi:xanthine dehydrogenase accessory factor